MRLTVLDGLFEVVEVELVVGVNVVPKFLVRNRRGFLASAENRSF